MNSQVIELDGYTVKIGLSYFERENGLKEAEWAMVYKGSNLLLTLSVNKRYNIKHPVYGDVLMGIESMASFWNTQLNELDHIVKVWYSVNHNLKYEGDNLIMFALKAVNWKVSESYLNG